MSRDDYVTDLSTEKLPFERSVERPDLWNSDLAHYHFIIVQWRDLKDSKSQCFSESTGVHHRTPISPWLNLENIPILSWTQITNCLLSSLFREKIFSLVFTWVHGLLPSTNYIELSRSWPYSLESWDKCNLCTHNIGHL